MADQFNVPIPREKPEYQIPSAHEAEAQIIQNREKMGIEDVFDSGEAPYSDTPSNQICETCSRPYVLFIGGFADKLTKIVYKEYLKYKKTMDDDGKLQYVFYQYQSPFYTGFARDLNPITRGGKAYHSKFKRTVVIVAHSWGCTTAMRMITDKLLPNGMKVRLLVTCDPVGNINTMKRPPNIEYWHNIYVDYNIEGNRIYHQGILPTANGIALIDKYVKIPGTILGMKGGPMGPNVEADINEPFIYQGQIVIHPNAHGYFGEMFQQAESEVKKIL